jgi:hypothetical protein
MALQLVPIITSVQPDESWWGALLLFCLSLMIGTFAVNRCKTRPRYVWLIVAAFGHVAGFSYKSFFFHQMNFLGLSKNAGLILLAIPFLLVQAGIIQGLFGLHHTNQRYVLQNRKPDQLLPKARLQMANTDIRTDAFAATTGYLFFAAGAAVFKHTSEEMHHLFVLEEPPCLKSEHGSGTGSSGHHGSNSSNSSHNHHRFLLSESNSNSNSNSSNTHGNHDNSISTDVLSLCVWLVCFFILPILEYYLYMFARQQNRKAHASATFKNVTGEMYKQRYFCCRRWLASFWYSSSSHLLGTLAAAIPFCLAYQGHALIVNAIFEKMAHEAKDEEAETSFLVVLILCALGGFALSSIFPAITDTKQEALVRKGSSQNNGSGASGASDDHSAHSAHSGHNHSVSAAKKNSFSSIYRTKMLTSSHKEMWAVWVALLFEIAAACAISKSTHVSLTRWLVQFFTVLVFFVGGDFLGGPFSEIFEHHLHEQIAEETEGMDVVNPLQQQLHQQLTPASGGADAEAAGVQALAGFDARDERDERETMDESPVAAVPRRDRLAAIESKRKNAGSSKV